MGIVIENIMALLPDGDLAPWAGKSTIYIEDGKIAALGEKPDVFFIDEVINGDGLFAVPGLINAHTHAYMTILRNHADDLPFETWLFDRVMPVEDQMTPEDAYWSSMLACAEMLRGGVTCFLDMHMHPGNSARAALDSGLRAVISRGLSGGKGDRRGGERRLKEALEEMDMYKDEDSVRFMLAPHAVYTTDEGYLREVAQAAKAAGAGIHTHLSETRNEVDQCLALYGCTPVALCDRCGLMGPGTVAAHCVRLKEGDISILRDKGVSVALNPGSNMKLGNGFAPVPELLSAGVNLCLGTDGAASNNSLSVLKELSLTALIHKGTGENPQMVTAGEAFLMASRNGARALGLGGVTGEIRQGLKADLALFPLADPGLAPSADLLSILAYSSWGLRADTVIVDGGILMRKGEFSRIDLDRIYHECEKISRRLLG